MPPSDYAHYLSDAAARLAQAPPPSLPSLLLVVGMCAALTAVTLWMQSVQLWVPLAFYRTETGQVRRGWLLAASSIAAAAR